MEPRASEPIVHAGLAQRTASARWPVYWLEENAQFPQKTAHRYMSVYANRVKLVSVTNLADAYRIALPKKEL